MLQLFQERDNKIYSAHTDYYGANRIAADEDEENENELPDGANQDAPHGQNRRVIYHPYERSVFLTPGYYDSLDQFDIKVYHTVYIPYLLVDLNTWVIIMTSKADRQYKVLLPVSYLPGVIDLGAISQCLNYHLIDSSMVPPALAWTCHLYETASAPNIAPCDTFERIQAGTHMDNMTNSIRWLLPMLVCVIHQCPQTFTANDVAIFEKKFRYYMFIGAVYL